MQPRLRSCGAAHSVGSINCQVSHFSSAAAPSVHHPSFETWAYGLTTAWRWPCPRTSLRLWPAAATTTAQRTMVTVAWIFYTTRGRLPASAVGLLQWSPGWTSCQSAQLTAVRSPRGSATDPWRPSIRPCYTAAAAASLAVSARTSDFQTLHHRVCRNVCMVSALNTSRRTSGSCPRFILASDCIRPPVPTLWFLPHAGLHLVTAHSRSQELEHGTHYHPVSPPHHLCPHSSDSWRHFFSSDNCVNNTNYRVVFLKCLATQHHVNLGELNWTELTLLLFNVIEMCLLYCTVLCLYISTSTVHVCTCSLRRLYWW